MEIIFNCPHCDQELSADSAGAGSEIECPTCGEKITIPQTSTRPTTENLPTASVGGQPVNPIASSAAAKVEKHLKVPLREAPTEILIQKTAAPLEAVAKGADKKIRQHTIRHASCVESGHDKFDEKVTEFLNEVGEANIISTHIISYTHFDVGSQKILNDYGLIVIYRG
jgi:DNA-directed RNA polymerase subunit RPC12/RpoP